MGIKETISNIIFAVGLVTLVILLALLAMMLAIDVRRAHAHDGTDPQAAWYRSLMTRNDMSCCSPQRDCRPVADNYQAGSDAKHPYRILWEDQWVDVDADAIINRSDNPTGHPVACVLYINGKPHVRCFIRPSEG